jgi:hypothetical protein
MGIFPQSLGWRPSRSRAIGPRTGKRATARSFSWLARHEMRDRLDVVVGHRIGDLWHDDVAAPPPRAMLIVVQGVDNGFLALPGQAPDPALADECIEVTLRAVTVVDPRGAFLGAFDQRPGLDWLRLPTYNIV